MRKYKTSYYTPKDWVCPICGEPGQIIPLDNSFYYSGTHCTGGRDGTEYPAGYGSPVCSSNDCEIDDAEYDEYDFYPGEI